MNVLDVERGTMATVGRSGSRIAFGAAAPDAAPAGYLGPGWVDVQVNGFAGHDVNAGDLRPEGFEAMTRALHAVGVTRYLPTVVTASPAHMAACLGGVVAARAASVVVARAVSGIHLEGPFVSPEPGARGAHPVAHVLAPDRALFDDLQGAADGTIRLVTLAPEAVGAVGLIEHLVAHGVTVALGHTLADGAAIRAAVDAGARLSTHLGNGVPAELPRHPNPIWEQLADDRLFASAIFDGHHLPDALMRVFARVKGPRLLLVSDAVALAGMPPGVYRGQVGGTVELLPSGRLTLYGTPYLAGSARSLLDGVNAAFRRAGATPEAAMSMAGRAPRTLLGLDDGDDWTVLRVDGDGSDVVAVAVGGELVVDRLGG